MNNKKLIALIIMSAIALALGILIPLKAADKPQSHSDTAGFIEVIKVMKLTHELELSSGQLMVFYPKYDELQKLKRKYSIVRREAMKEFNRLLANENAAEREFEDAFRKYRDNEASIVHEMVKLRDELESQLSPIQKIKFMLFNYSYQRDVEKILKTVNELNKSKKKYIPLPVKENR